MSEKNSAESESTKGKKWVITRLKEKDARKWLVGKNGHLTTILASVIEELIHTENALSSIYVAIQALNDYMKAVEKWIQATEDRIRAVSKETLGTTESGPLAGINANLDLLNLLMADLKEKVDNLESESKKTRDYFRDLGELR